MTTYQQILIIFDNFEIIFIGALFPPGTAVTDDTRNPREPEQPLLIEHTPLQE